MIIFLKKCKKEIIFFIFSNLVWAVIGISLAYLLGFIMDTAINNTPNRIIIIIMGACMYIAMDAMFEFLSNYSEILLRTRISMLIRDALVRRIQRSSIEEKEENGDAYYLSMFNNNVTEIDNNYIHGILMVVFQVFSLVFALAATTIIQPIMTIIILLLCILPIFVPKLLKTELENINREAVAAKATYLNFLNEWLEGFLSIKIFNSENVVNTYHDKQNRQTTKTMQKNSRWRRFSMSLSYGMGNMVVVGAWAVGAVFAVKGSITIPELVELTTLMNMVAGPFQIISEYYAGIVSGRAVAKDLLDYIGSENDNQAFNSSESSIEKIELKNIDVVRDQVKLLNGFNFAVKNNMKIAVIGRSGSGKTTALKAIAGIVNINSGNICINDYEVNNKGGLTHKDIIYLPQHTVVFSASIKENISMFKETTEEEVINAIRLSGLSEWFSNLGNDIYKKIEKSSINLSGGELRRLEFGRILISNPKVILFDEPTSGLDFQNSQNIMSQICSMKDKLIVVSTHDVSKCNLKRFDYIYVVDYGNVIAEGAPCDIIRGEAYRLLRKDA
ncbi:MAG: ABC transporter ATP-binding protein/permease [Butyrivibrio sp.]|nr:ABC transporter ATP-binding protein/permease [Butyrivibrio sp.]